MHSYLSPEEITLCERALEAACAKIGTPSEGMRTEMAARIMTRAVSGERDLEDLIASATSWIQTADS